MGKTVHKADDGLDDVDRARIKEAAALRFLREARRELAALGETPADDALLDVREAAAHCRVHANTLYAAAKTKALRARRVGRHLRFSVADLDAWMGAR